MKKGRIKDWGCEIEISNYPLVAQRNQYEDLGFIRNNKEKTILCHIDDFIFTNDPSGRHLDFGGELNSKPFKTKEELMKVCMELEKRLNLTTPHYSMEDAAFHVHITLEDDVLNDLSEVARFCNGMGQNYDFFRPGFKDPFKYEVKSDFGGNLSKESYLNLAYHCQELKTGEKMQPYYFYKPGDYDRNFTPKQIQFLRGMYKRPEINFIQYYQTQTIEIRAFRLRSMKDGFLFVKFIEQLIEAFNKNDLSLIERYPDSYQIKPFYPGKKSELRKTTYRHYLRHKEQNND